MFFILFLLFVGMPMIELYLLLKLGAQIGALNTFGIVLVTGFVGAFLAKSQGRAIFAQIQGELNKGGVPADSLLHGLLVFVGGLLLITPGFVTDAFGFFLVVPFTRFVLVKAVKAHLKHAVATGKYKFYSGQSQGFPGGAGFKVYTYSNHSQRSSETFQGGPRAIRDVNPEVIDD
ncbi:MAG: FxsA family protein [Bdellovibrionales bacterium]|nr:FxsA family protein [Bdellovibrionales bacterium]